MTAIFTASDVAMFQADAEALMLDSCRIERPNPSDWTADAVVVYEGKCEVKGFTRAARDQQEAGGTTSDPHRCIVKIPVAVDGVEFNDHVIITASLNPSMVPFDTFVSDIAKGSAVSAQRLVCQRSLR